MKAERNEQGPTLILVLRGQHTGRHLRVSALSSLLRVFQAAVRDVARADETTRPLIEGSGGPSLHVTNFCPDTSGVTMEFQFVSPDDSHLHNRLPERVFYRFMEQLGSYLTAVSQPSLWGRTGQSLQLSTDQSDVARRMAQVSSELRRFSRSTLKFSDRKIGVEGKHLELS